MYTRELVYGYCQPSGCWYQTLTKHLAFLFPSLLFHSFFSTNIIILLHAFPLHLDFSLASCLSLLMPHHVWLFCAYLPLLHNKTMKDLITPVTHLTASFISGFFSCSISHFLWAYPSFFPLSFPIIFDEQENMLTCVPSVLQIKTLVAMCATPSTGQQAPFSAGPFRGWQTCVMD